MKRSLAILLLAFTLLPSHVFAAAANHLLISEIQVGNSAGADNEYVELFNPTTNTINLNGLRLQVGTSTNLVSSMSGSLASGKRYLIAKPSYTTLSITPDAYYSASSSAITSNSTIKLLETDHLTVIDLVGMGSAAVFEASAAASPQTDQTLQRTPICEDSNNNFDDFISSVATPENSSASAILCTTPTPTLTPTPSPTLTPTPTTTVTPTPTATPSSTPTMTPTPTVTTTPTPPLSPTPTVTPTPSTSPSPTPSTTPSVTPTLTTTPSPTPTTQPTPTSVPTHTPTPTLIPTPTTTPTPPSPITFNYPLMTCTISYQTKFFFNHPIYFPKISCQSKPWSPFTK